MEMSDSQFYDVRRSDKNRHFQLFGGTQIDRYICGLVSRDFVELKDPNAEASRPGKYFIRLRKECDYFLDEVTVVNNVDSDPIMKEVMSKIPFQDMGQKMFVDEYEAVKKKKGKDTRRNLRWDAGFTVQNSTDGRTVQGMNIPARNLTTRKQIGYGDDCSREHTMFKSACAVLEMYRHIKGVHPNQTSKMAEDIFVELPRNEVFSHPWAKELQLFNEYEEFCCFEGTSAFATGEAPDFRVWKTEEHFDYLNDTKRRHDHSITALKLVDVELPDDTTIEVRVGVNVYNKSCCSLTMKKIEVNRVIAQKMRSWSASFAGGSRKKDSLSNRFIPTDESEDIWTYDADPDKDGYYSLFCNEIIILAGHFGMDRALMLEILMTMSMTPCPKVWMEGVRYAGDALVHNNHRKRSARNSNFVSLYVDYLRGKYGTVSHGEYNRCRSSHRSSMTYRQLYVSLANLDKLMCMADNTNDTGALMKKMSSSPSSGGLFGVGPFWAQSIINVATKVGLIKNTVHARNPVVATSTATYKRLREKMGILNANHAASLVPWLAHELGESCEVVENKLCEMLRDMYGTSGKKDVFVRGHLLFRIEDQSIVSVNCFGERESYTYSAPCFTGEYMPSTLWWKISFKSRVGTYFADWTNLLMRKNV